MAKIISLSDFIGKRFGRLIVKQFAGKKKFSIKGHLLSFFICKCECGNIKEVPSNQLKSGYTQSCGCLRSENGKIQGRNNGIKLTKPNFQSNKNELFYSYKQSAKKRGLDFSLTQKHFENLIEKNCFYCQDPPSNSHRNTKHSFNIFSYNGIDRLDNNKGYDGKNTVPCCTFCNVAKHHHSKDYFLDKIKKIHKIHGNH